MAPRAPTPKSNPFGAARPVDTAAKLKELEDKAAQRVVEEERRKAEEERSKTEAAAAAKVAAAVAMAEEARQRQEAARQAEEEHAARAFEASQRAEELERQVGGRGGGDKVGKRDKRGGGRGQSGEGVSGAPFFSITV